MSEVDRTRMKDLLEHLATQREVLRRAVDSVPVALREQRPRPDRWSVAEVLEHLAIVERRVALMISNLVATAPELGDSQRSALSSDMVRQQLSTLLDRSRRLATNEAGTPSGNFNARDAWIALEASRNELLGVLERARGLELGGFVRPHPLLGPLNTYEWIAFVGGHDARHAAQIDEVSREIGG
jgi:hypothetical protein